MTERQPAPSADEQQRLVTLLRQIAEQETTWLHTGRRSWRGWLEQAAAYGQYGFTNTLLISAQVPAATQVLAYNQWQELGRQVAKGERGIRILTTGGKTRAVFDLSQTHGDDLPVSKPLTAAEGRERLSALAVSVGLYVQRGSDAWHVYTPDQAQRLITIDPELPDSAAAFGLSHQLAHVHLHGGRLDHPGADCVGVDRVEADSVAVLLLSHLGLDLPDVAFRPPATWAGTDPRAQPTEAIRNVGERILRTARQIRIRVDRLPAPSPSQVPTPAPEPEQAPTESEPLVVTVGPLSPALSAAPTKEDLAPILQAAQGFFRSQLAGSWVPAYLDQRGLDENIRETWAIGYAPAAWRALTDHLRGHGYRDDLIIASGLARRGRTGVLYDTFRDRCMIGVRNTDAVLCGFVGRCSDRPANASVPKYLNTVDTPLFRKGQLLFGLHEAQERLSQGARLVLVEGPFDVMAINASSSQHAAAAPCGAGLSSAQARLVEAAISPGSGVLCAYDNDQAGNAAALHAWDVLSHLEGPLGIVQFPKGQDPADVMRYSGCVAVREALQTETPLVDIAIDTAVSRVGSLKFLENRLAAARAATAAIARIHPSQAARQITRIADQLGLDYGTVTSFLTSAISPVPEDPAGIATTGFPMPPLTGPPSTSTVQPAPDTASPGRHRTNRPT